MGRAWTQAPSNLPPHPHFRHGNLALQPRFRQTSFPIAPVPGLTTPVLVRPITAGAHRALYL